MISFTVRPLTESDWPAWWALRLAALRDHPDAFGESHADALAGEDDRRIRFAGSKGGDRNKVFGVFTAEGALVGACGVVGNDREKTRHRMYIWGTYVAPSYRSAGVGQRLVKVVIEHARHVDGVLQVHLTVASHNEAAIALYSRLGFHQYGHEPRSLKLPDRFVDEAFMVLMLDTSPPE